MADAAVPANENRPVKLEPLALAVRRLVLLDRARSALGGAARLGDALGIGRRAANHKLQATRGVRDDEVRRVADALDARVAEIDRLAADLRALLPAVECGS